MYINIYTCVYIYIYTHTLLYMFIYIYMHIFDYLFIHGIRGSHELLPTETDSEWMGGLVRDPWWPRLGGSNNFPSCFTFLNRSWTARPAENPGRFRCFAGDTC